MSTRYTGRRVRASWTPPAGTTPEIYQTNAYVGPGWNSSIPPPTGYTHTEDLIIGHSGFMGYFNASNDYDWDAGGAGVLTSSTVTSKCFGTDSSIFGTRSGLTIYGNNVLALGTLSSSGLASIGTGFDGGFSGGASHYANVHAARRVYRGTNAARRVIGATNSDTTATDQTTVTVPGITVPSNNSLVILVVLAYGSAYTWYQDGNTSDGWTRPAGQLFGRSIYWKLFPAGATGNLSFTNMLGATTYAAYKRQLYLICLDSNTAP